MLRFVVSPRCRDGFADLEALVDGIGARHEVDYRLLHRDGRAADWAVGLKRDSTLVLCLDLEQDLVLCKMDGEYNDFLRQAVARTRGRVAIVMRGGDEEREEVLYSMSDQMKSINAHRLLFFWEDLMPQLQHDQAELLAACSRVRTACAAEAVSLLREPSYARGVNWPLLVGALVLLGVGAVIVCAPWAIQWPPGVSFIGSARSSAKLWDEQLRQRNDSLNAREEEIEQRSLALDQREMDVERKESAVLAQQQQAAVEEQRLKEEAIRLKVLHDALDRRNATLIASQRIHNAKEREFNARKQREETERKERMEQEAETAQSARKGEGWLAQMISWLG